MWRGIVVSEKIISTSSNLSLQNICEIGVGEFSKMSCTNYNDVIFVMDIRTIRYTLYIPGPTLNPLVSVPLQYLVDKLGNFSLPVPVW